MDTFKLAKKAISLIDETSIRIQLYAHEPISHTTATFEDERELELSKEEAQYLVQQHLKDDEEIQSLLTGQDLFEDVHPQAFNLEERLREIEEELTEYLAEDYEYDFDYAVLNLYLDAWNDFIKGILMGNITDENFDNCIEYFEECGFDDETPFLEYVDFEE